jgi:carboxyl-terminal processing protease
MFLNKKSVCMLGIAMFFSLQSLAATESLNDYPREQLKKFAEVYSVIKNNYVEDIDDNKLFNDAITGALAGLDPHSTYLDYEGLKDFGIATGGEFGGLGLEVGMEDGLVKVVSPIEDTPAYRAGIKPGDLITQLDGVSVKGLTIGDAIKKMRGKPDTQIKLSILRKGEAGLVEITLTRAIIKNPSVKYKLTDSGYPYVRITQFQEHTGEDLAKALATIREKTDGPLKGLVLDLRNNPGGLVVSAVSVSAAFLKKDALVVYSDGKTPDSKMRLFANPRNYSGPDSRDDYLKDLPPEMKTVPMVVLVNAGSASAAEIVSGALQDHGRAKVLGVQSFGKGTIQTLLPLSNGSAVKLTVARYFTPSGRSIQAKGITPDVIVEDPAITPEEDAKLRRESSLANHLANSKEVLDKDKQHANVANIEKEPARTQFADSGQFEAGTDKDFQYSQAINLLKGLEVTKVKAK